MIPSEKENPLKEKTKDFMKNIGIKKPRKGQSFLFC